jgi:hypothetical protein
VSKDALKASANSGGIHCAKLGLMTHAEARRWFLAVSLTSMVFLACGGVTVERSPSSGGASNDGGATSGSGGSGNAAGRAGTGGKSAGNGGSVPGTAGAGGVLTDCSDVLPESKACSSSGAHCGGPCSDSWQADYVCDAGAWTYGRVVPCGPDASHAPQCHNSFSGGSLTPCCGKTLDCTGKPDGYPGFGCTPDENSFCSCNCSAGMKVCGC